MQKSRIEWTDYTLNPIKGLCPVDCKDNQGKSYCYARRMYKRFKWREDITLTSRWDAELEHIKPSRIFVGSTFELFGGFIPDEWLRDIFLKVKIYPWHTFIFLTKQPQNLPRWSPFPDNCYIGASVVDQSSYERALKGMSYVSAKVRFLSFEPLLSPVSFLGRDLDIFHWVIIGAQSPHSKKTAPKWEWVREIVKACNKAGIPIFLKNNLGLPKYSCEGAVPFYKGHPPTMDLRQEMPHS